MKFFIFRVAKNMFNLKLIKKTKIELAMSLQEEFTLLFLHFPYLNGCMSKY
jgi:hypothetical protein